MSTINHSPLYASTKAEMLAEKRKNAKQAMYEAQQEIYEARAKYQKHRALFEEASREEDYFFNEREHDHTKIGKHRGTYNDL